jgi:hypothetical protein
MRVVRRASDWPAWLGSDASVLDRLADSVSAARSASSHGRMYGYGSASLGTVGTNGSFWGVTLQGTYGIVVGNGNIACRVRDTWVRIRPAYSIVLPSIRRIQP